MNLKGPCLGLCYFQHTQKISLKIPSLVISCYADDSHIVLFFDVDEILKATDLTNYTSETYTFGTNHDFTINSSKSELILFRLFSFRENIVKSYNVKISNHI